MKKISILMLVSVSIFANSVVDIYRKDGINAVEKYINKQLETKTFWKEKLKGLNTTLGYYEKVDSLLVANKNKKELKLYKNSKNNIKLLETYQDVIVGADGDKYKEGDLKTPLGVYTIKRKITPSDQFYGPLAFILSYPNTFDKIQGKDGHGIWIHGSPLDGSQRNSMSKGCIVLDNKRIETLDGKIEKPKGSIIIVNEKGMKEVAKDEISTILSDLFKWKRAWVESDSITYLSYYSNDFVRYDGMKKKRFFTIKRTIFSRKQKKKIVFKDINISPYPSQNGKRLFKVAFYEIYKSKAHKFSGNKELFIELANNKIKILSEK